VGYLAAPGPWVGFAHDADGYRLAFGETQAADTAAAQWVSDAEGAARLTELLTVAIVYYGEMLEGPPPSLEATQADLAELVRWLGMEETDLRRRLRLSEALDAIDDGLAGEVVVARLSGVLALAGSPKTDEQADPLDLLVSRYEALSASSA